MKTTRSRRNFMGAMMLGATASTLSAFTNPAFAGMTDFTHLEMNDAEAWMKSIKGKHRIVYDGSYPHSGFPIIWNWAYYLSNNEMGSTDDEITAMTVLRHDAIPFALHDDLWKAYPLGEMFHVKKADGTVYDRNPYYEPQEGDFPLPVIQGIKDLMDRGAMFCVCNLALNVYSGAVAQQMGKDPNEVYEEWKAAVLPEIQIVPSGVWALGRAQEEGCGYIFAGNTI
ncbi:Tat (twin-arginine translocation) pathway signal sequence containing protein [Flagellimonas halotolerans]|uniref:Tat (Twin-arginine translocation) pathway signal sequence containing protein n=1 Tax=Flagellimonas halotolerans TaxID=3112164 RepID=A0ABU6IMN0_9FLAO|nr:MULTISPECIES: Tat (twin-arginine translocation) pathway signal sequence containing protein [unclassified Allomuricauda]MEC3964424.1 Tat (twin-arginine translocation) pathway signal sequence containing protein [Muricauda sp. SYSU M86414]MEC4264294.1 Tat (twin-arginine translocation) pathway signal sequence containing protein [Muricauda sp. SYSU M84420]